MSHQQWEHVSPEDFVIERVDDCVVWALAEKPDGSIISTFDRVTQGAEQAWN
jgi:hypothetical protein